MRFRLLSKRRLNSIKRRVRKLKNNNLFIFLSILFVIVFTGSVLLYLIETTNSNIDNIFDTIWLSIVTITTVGYGDIAPVTPTGRIIGIILIFVGVAFSSAFTAFIASYFIEQRRKEVKGLNQISFTDHFILCGWNSSADIILTIFDKFKDMDDYKIVLVNSMDEDQISEIFVKYEDLNIKFVKGDYTKELILKRSNVLKARQIILLADELPLGDNAKSDEHIIIAAHLINYLNPKIKISAQIRSTANIPHLKKLDVQDIISFYEYGGYLMANTIISPGITNLYKDILAFQDNTGVSIIDIPEDLVDKEFKEVFLYFKEHENRTVIGIHTEEESMSIDNFLGDDPSSIDNFIKATFQQAQKNIFEDTKEICFNINPDLSYIIKHNDKAIVLGS